jgi:hypothetical protein
MRSGVILGDLSCALLEDLSANGGEILGLAHGNAAAQVKQSAGQGLQDDLVAPADERNAIAFPEL